MQKDHGIYFKFSHLTQEGIDTEFNFGNSVCHKTLSSEISRLSNDNRETANAAVKNAIENKWLLIFIIDHYTCVHLTRRPTNQQTSSSINMCTIVCRIFPNIPGIPLKSTEELHHRDSIGSFGKKHDITCFNACL